MMLRRISIVLVAALAATSVYAQTILQGGQTTPGHVLQYFSSGSSQPVAGDGGGAAGGSQGVNPNEFGVTSLSPTGTYPVATGGSGLLGTHVCYYDAPITNATGYHSLCFDANAQGGGLISYGAGGGAAQLPFQINVNGVTGLPSSALAIVNVNTGSFGSGANVPTFTVNGAGQITAASSVAVTPAISNVTGMGSGVATALAQSGGNVIDSLSGASSVGLFERTGTGTYSIAVPGQIPGVASSTAASAGNVGEYLVSQVGSGSAVALTSTTQTNVTSLTLTAGDWDVWGQFYFVPASGTTVTSTAGAVSAVSGSFGVTSAQSVVTMPISYTGNASVLLSFGTAPQVFQISTSTTYYLVAQSTFAVSTQAVYGYIRARRVR